jgi:hypothetical protein
VCARAVGWRGGGAGVRVGVHVDARQRFLVSAGLLFAVYACRSQGQPISELLNVAGQIFAIHG